MQLFLSMEEEKQRLQINRCSYTGTWLVSKKYMSALVEK